MVRRYLLVDDNAAFAENLAEILRDEGAEVSIANSGAQALQLVRRERFDVLITDMKMPGMNGAELVHEIRRFDAALPAILVSAYTGEEALIAALEEGLLAVLPKPVPIKQLLELVARARRGGIVALIEDDLAFTENLAEALRDRGFSAVVADSLAQTDRLSGLHPFVALVDLRMPGMKDGAILRHVRDHFPGMKTVIVTAYATTESLRSGMTVFEKPCDTEALLGAIERLYQEHPQQPEPMRSGSPAE